MRTNIYLLFALLCVLFLSSGCNTAAEITDSTPLPPSYSDSTADQSQSADETESITESEVATDPDSELPTETETETETEMTVPAPSESECRITSFIVPADKNPNMCESIIGKISDNIITLEICAPTDTFSLLTAYVDIATDAASYTLSGGSASSVDLISNGGCTCTLTDANGLSRTYQIVVEYSGSTIPVISIRTDSGNAVTSKDNYIGAVISIDTSGTDGWFLPEGFESLEPTEVQIKGRGNSTWEWDKKPYKLKFESKTAVLGMEKAKKWVLLANYADYSLMRNYVAMEASKVLSDETSPLSQYPVNLFINGEYQGVYTIGEDHEVKNGRIDLSKNNGTADTSFVLEIGGSDSEDIWGKTAFSTGLIRYCSIEYPEDNEITQEQADFIIQYCKEADAAIKSLSDYEDYIDVDSFIDWFISNEYFYNLESCFRRSCFLIKEPGGKLKMGPIWDLDLAMGNLYNDFSQYEIWAALAQKYEYVEDNWFCYLMKDEAFRVRLRDRWNEVKHELLEVSLNSIDRMEETLRVSAGYNFDLWDVLGTRAVRPQPKQIVKLKTYEDNVKYIRDFLVDRWNWMDKTLNG